MTREELYHILRYVSHATDSLDLIWGQPFDGETEKITERDTKRDTESSATGSEPLPNGTTYTRSYQVFLPTPKPIQTKPIFSTPNSTQPNQ